MTYDPDVFCIQFAIVKRFVYHLTYHRELRKVYREVELKSEFWTHTIDAHILQAAISWCMVFGADGCNPTHWKRLSQSNVQELTDNFRKTLFDETSFTPSTWQNYWKQMLNFRNRYAAHRELDFHSAVPDFSKGLDVAYVYDRWIRELIYPDIFGEAPLKESASKLCESIRPFVARLLNITKQYNKDVQPLV